jgi:hypothetical protein
MKFLHLNLDFQTTFACNHNMTVFDELAQQCQIVLHTTRLRPTSHLSSLVNTNDSMMNEYERRFQCSLQKLSIPTWYTDIQSSDKHRNKPSIISKAELVRVRHRSPEIVHVTRPHSSRSCYSSLTASPSPSAHSWHPNHLNDTTNLSSLPPSASLSFRRQKTYIKGIDRVKKSSQWYRPSQLTVISHVKPCRT